MKLTIPCILLLLIFAVVPATAQDAPTPDVPPSEFKKHRPNLFLELGLTPEQMEQIRALNAERRPLMHEAHKKLREANLALDMAIYADSFDEGVMAARLKDYQAAQSEVARLRFANELAVRKILTADQLIKFRELRQRFGNRVREKLEKRRGTDPGNRQLRFRMKRPPAIDN